MGPNRIICIGNPLHPADRAGHLVLAELADRRLPPGTTVTDGGLAGLNLLPLVEGARRVVFVDSLLEDGGPVQVLVPGDPRLQADVTYGHGAGLGYLLRLLPAVIEGPVPEICIVAVPADRGAELAGRAATISLELAAGKPAGAGGGA